MVADWIDLVSVFGTSLNRSRLVFLRKLLVGVVVLGIADPAAGRSEDLGRLESASA